MWWIITAGAAGLSFFEARRVWRGYRWEKAAPSCYALYDLGAYDAVPEPIDFQSTPAPSAEEYMLFSGLRP